MREAQESKSRSQMLADRAAILLTIVALARIEIKDARIDKASTQGKTVVFMIVDYLAVGAIALADTIRPESKDAVSQLKEMGIQTIMITGDSKEVADCVTSEIGISSYLVQVLPRRKQKGSRN